MQYNITIITPYSYPSKCGIWERALTDARFLHSNGNIVHMLSSSVLKGTKNHTEEFIEMEGIKIFRFKPLFSIGENALFFFFFKKLNQLKPDIIHTHGYRHPHSLIALFWAKLNRKKIIITTHGPFKKDPNRKIIIKLFDFFYDILIGFWSLQLYDSIVYISKWEKPFLKRLFVPTKKMFYIPNSIKSIFLEQDKSELIEHERQNSAFYMGRLDPVKRLETIVWLAKNIPSMQFYIYGPLSGYKDFLHTNSNLQTTISPYESKDFIDFSKKNKYFIQPSARESFGITILEAMSQGCIVFSSNTKGANEMIISGVNGFIFNSNSKLLAQINSVNSYSKNQIEEIQKNAIETAYKFSPEIANKALEQMYQSLNIAKL